MRPLPRSGNKYHNVRTEYGGQTFDSALEVKHAKELDALKSASDPAERVTSWSRQEKFKFVVNGTEVSTYRADFLVRYGDGRLEVHECKGIITPAAKIKLRLFEALYPNYPLILIRR